MVRIMPAEYTASRRRHDTFSGSGFAGAGLRAASFATHGPVDQLSHGWCSPNGGWQTGSGRGLAAHRRRQTGPVGLVDHATRRMNIFAKRPSGLWVPSRNFTALTSGRITPASFKAQTVMPVAYASLGNAWRCAQPPSERCSARIGSASLRSSAVLAPAAAAPTRRMSISSRITGSACVSHCLPVWSKYSCGAFGALCVPAVFRSRPG